MTSRRAILAGAAAIPALSLPAIACEPDPIFAAIETHRSAELAYLTACDHPVIRESLHHPELEALEEHVHELCHESNDCYADLLATTPTTVAGCSALLRHIERHEHEYDSTGLFGNCTDEVKENGNDVLSRIAAVLVEQLG
jgi:hypothetical protein